MISESVTPLVWSNEKNDKKSGRRETEFCKVVQDGDCNADKTLHFVDIEKTVVETSSDFTKNIYNTNTESIRLDKAPSMQQICKEQLARCLGQLMPNAAGYDFGFAPRFTKGTNSTSCNGEQVQFGTNFIYDCSKCQIDCAHKKIDPCQIQYNVSNDEDLHSFQCPIGISKSHISLHSSAKRSCDIYTNINYVHHQFWSIPKLLLAITLLACFSLTAEAVQSYSAGYKPCQSATRTSVLTYERHPGNCSVFYICHGHTHWPMTCKEQNTVFSLKHKVCVWKNSIFDDCQEITIKPLDMPVPDKDKINPQDNYAYSGLPDNAGTTFMDEKLEKINLRIAETKESQKLTTESRDTSTDAKYSDYNPNNYFKTQTKVQGINNLNNNVPPQKNSPDKSDVTVTTKTQQNQMFKTDSLSQKVVSNDFDNSEQAEQDNGIQTGNHNEKKDGYESKNVQLPEIEEDGMVVNTEDENGSKKSSANTDYDNSEETESSAVTFENNNSLKDDQKDLDSGMQEAIFDRKEFPKNQEAENGNLKTNSHVYTDALPGEKSWLQMPPPTDMSHVNDKHSGAWDNLKDIQKTEIQYGMNNESPSWKRSHENDPIKNKVKPIPNEGLTKRIDTGFDLEQNKIVPSHIQTNQQSQFEEISTHKQEYEDNKENHLWNIKNREKYTTNERIKSSTYFNPSVTKSPRSLTPDNVIVVQPWPELRRKLNKSLTKPKLTKQTIGTTQSQNNAGDNPRLMHKFLMLLNFADHQQDDLLTNEEDLNTKSRKNKYTDANVHTFKVTTNKFWPPQRPTQSAMYTFTNKQTTTKEPVLNRFLTHITDPDRSKTITKLENGLDNKNSRTTIHGQEQQQQNNYKTPSRQEYQQQRDYQQQRSLQNYQEELRNKMKYQEGLRKRQKLQEELRNKKKKLETELRNKQKLQEELRARQKLQEELQRERKLQEEMMNRQKMQEEMQRKQRWQEELQRKQKLQEELQRKQKLQEELQRKQKLQEELQRKQKVQEEMQRKQKLQEELQRKQKLQKELQRKQKLQEELERKQKLYEELERKQKVQEELQRKHRLQEELQRKQKLQEELQRKQKVQEELQRKQRLQEELQRKQRLQVELQMKQRLQEELQRKQRLQEELQRKQKVQEELRREQRLQEELQRKQRLQEELQREQRLQEELQRKQRLQEELQRKQRLQEELQRKQILQEELQRKQKVQEELRREHKLQEELQRKQKLRQQLRKNQILQEEVRRERKFQEELRNKQKSQEELQNKKPFSLHKNDQFETHHSWLWKLQHKNEDDYSHRTKSENNDYPINLDDKSEESQKKDLHRSKLRESPKLKFDSNESEDNDSFELEQNRDTIRNRNKDNDNKKNTKQILKDNLKKQKQFYFETKLNKTFEKRPELKLKRVPTFDFENGVDYDKYPRRNDPEFSFEAKPIPDYTVPQPTTTTSIITTATTTPESHKTTTEERTMPPSEEPGYVPLYRQELRERCGVLATPLIIGGQKSRTDQWPWQVSLQIVTSTTPWHRCGGVLVHPKWVLTAAHCMEGPFYGDVSNWRVVLADYDLEYVSGNEIYRDIVRVISHPGYVRTSNFPNDVALLELDSPVDLTSGEVQTACLPDADFALTPGTQCWISGWGETRGTGGQENTMNEVAVDVLSHDQCKSMWGKVNIDVLDSQVCLGYGVTGACYGDSGGPLMCQSEGRFYVAGVMSWLINNCSANNFPNVFTRLPSYMDWVHQELDYFEWLQYS